jgi:Abnormal spindle-like microcephaly-assoc'd, ASPM-SPD-2-Hydin
MKFLPRMVLALCVSAWPVAYAGAQLLQCNPCSYDYGQVQIGSTKRFILQLSNTGSQALTISSKRKIGKDFWVGNFPLPVTLQPETNTQIRVSFKPSVTGKIAGTITLLNNGSNPSVTINISGTGVSANAATLAVSPPSLDFGNVTVGASASLQLALTASNGPVTISSAQANSSEFTLPGFILPKTIAAGQSVSATVTFTPNASGTASANLVLVSDAANSPSTVPLTGVGVAAQPHSADLSWTASKNVVIGYNAYRGNTKGGPYTKINPVLDASTTYADNNVTAGATYYYVVTAVDASNVESTHSNEAQVLIPSP